MKSPRLSKSGIEYLDYSWGIFSGCRNLQVGICPVKACWAKSITERFANHYPDSFEPTFYPGALESPKHLKKPSIIGVGWVGDIIGYGLAYRDQIFETIKECPWHTFLFLTKNSEELIKWGNFSENCWVGVSVTSNRDMTNAYYGLNRLEATVKFISFEPLLGSIGMSDHVNIGKYLNWVIIGCHTPVSPKTMPKFEWVEEIINAADKAGIPVFIKPPLSDIMNLHRQELPTCERSRVSSLLP